MGTGSLRPMPIERKGCVGDAKIRRVVRTMDRQLMNGVAHRSSSRGQRCEIPGCEQTTREGKRFCPDHVEVHPYAKGIVDDLAAVEAEELRMNELGWQAVDINGLMVGEILLSLQQQNPRTEERLARETRIELETLRVYIQALVHHGLVHLGESHRRRVTVTLGPKPKGESGSKRRSIKKKAASAARIKKKSEAQGKNGGSPQARKRR